jgi:hypothetical protein
MRTAADLNVIGCKPEDVCIDMPVEVVFERRSLKIFLAQIQTDRLI